MGGRSRLPGELTILAPYERADGHESHQRHGCQNSWQSTHRGGPSLQLHHHYSVGAMEWPQATIGACPVRCENSTRYLRRVRGDGERTVFHLVSPWHLRQDPGVSLATSYMATAGLLLCDAAVGRKGLKSTKDWKCNCVQACCT